MLTLIAASADMITSDTGVSFGLLGSAAAVCLTIIGAAVAVSRKIDAVKATAQETDAKVGRLENQLKQHITVDAFAEHQLRLALNNPTLAVPDPRNPGKLLRDPDLQHQHHLHQESPR